MNRETIEKEARNFIEDFCHDHIDYTSINYEEDNYEAARNNTLWEFGTEIFMAGAEWRINSVWHDMNEKPNGIFVILADFGQEEYSLGISLDGIESAKRWAYVSDLLPERKEEKKWH